MTKEDPLSELLVDAVEADRRSIATALKGRVALDSSSGRLVLSPGYNDLDSRRKVLVVLLGRKAAFLLNLTDSEALTNKDVTDVSGLPPGTAAPGLKSLREMRLVSQDPSKAYYVPNAQILSAVGFLTGAK